MGSDLDAGTTTSSNIISKNLRSTRSITRSRNGCISCKKLKIKCDEEKPKCDYCIQTNRLCIYIKNPPIKLIKKTKIINDFFNNKTIEKLNSMTCQMNVSKFELQLIKYYLDFGPSFFSFNVDEKNLKFWSVQIPKLWSESELIKTCIYTVSCTRILANYNYGDGSVQHVYYDDDSNLDQKGKPTRVNLFSVEERNINKTNELINKLASKISLKDPNTIEDLCGQILIAKKIIGASIAIFPGNNNQNIKDLNSLTILKVLNSHHDFFKSLEPYLSILETTKYKYTCDPEQLNVEGYNYEFKFTQHLRNYIIEKLEPLDPLQIPFFEAISILEKGFKRAIVYKYPTPLFKLFVELSTQNYEFIQLLKSKNHIALKIIFYPICVLAMFDYKLYQKTGITREYITYYKNYSFRKFNNKFEDEVDENIYETMEARIKSKLPYDFNIIKKIGEPIDFLLNGDNEWRNLNAPDVFF